MLSSIETELSESSYTSIFRLLSEMIRAGRPGEEFVDSKPEIAAGANDTSKSPNELNADENGLCLLHFNGDDLCALFGAISKAIHQEIAPSTRRGRFRGMVLLQPDRRLFTGAYRSQNAPFAPIDL